MHKVSIPYSDESFEHGSLVSEPMILEGYVISHNYNRLYQAIRNVAFSYQQLYDYVMAWLKAPGITFQKSKSIIIADLMEVSESTVYRWRSSSIPVNTKHAERLTSLMDIYLYGAEVLGSREAFILWLSLPSTVLGGHTPLSRLDGTAGLKLVRHILEKIEYGAPL